MRYLALSFALACALMRCTTERCGPTTCAGCCDEGGLCQQGFSPSACGVTGAACVACGLGEQCGLGGCARPRCNLNGCPEPVVPPPTLRDVTLYDTQQLVGERTTTAVSRLGDAGVWLTAGGVERQAVREAARYVVAGVPVGPWVLRYGGLSVAGAWSSLDLGASSLGRDDAELLDAGFASLELSLSGLSPWEPGDRLQLLSVGAGVSAIVAAGQTTFSTDWAALGGGRAARLDATAGDTLRVVHLEETPVGVERAPDGGGRAVPCLVAGASARVQGLTLAPGPNSATVAFSSGEPRAVRVQLPPGAWDERASEVHPAAVRSAARWAVQAELVVGAQAGVVLSCAHRAADGWALDALDESVSSSTAWPADWARVGVAEVEYAVSVSGRAVHGQASVRVAEGAPLLPAVHAPAGLSVNGATAAGHITAWYGATLEVAWSRSAQPPLATDFEVRVVRLEAGGREQVVATALTRGEGFTFQPGLLVLGEWYAVKVRARVTTAAEERPYVVPPSSTAEAISSPFVAQ